MGDHFAKGVKNEFWENEFQLTAVRAATWAPYLHTLFGHLSPFLRCLAKNSILIINPPMFGGGR